MVNDPNSETKRQRKRLIRLASVIILVFILIMGGIKGWRIYQKSMTVYQNANVLRGMAQIPLAEMDIDSVELSLLGLQGDLNDLNGEVESFLWLAPSLGWVPVYGGDLSNAPALLDVADHLVAISISSLQAAKPIWENINSSELAPDPVTLTKLLVEAKPQLVDAQGALNGVLLARDNIRVEELSPRLHDLLVDKLDPLINLIDDGLSLSTTLPVILAATGEGPKSYLVLVQNEDELRPTGGFITSVGRLVIHNGEVVSLEFEGVDNEEDWSKPFPSAPWQLQEYMNTSVLILRDSNWFADFPTNVRWAKYLYAYNHPQPVDGVIAFDQQFLVMLLGIIGPLEVDGAPYAITNSNVIEYMRSAKEPPAGEPVPAGWYRKEFIGDIAHAVLDDLLGDSDNDWRGLAVTLIRALDERHLLVQFDDPMVKEFLAKKDWDNAVRPTDGDFLMTTDSNIGFNKTTAIVNVSMSYDVDLTNLSTITGTLTITHENGSGSDIPCIHWDSGKMVDETSYPINRCYWNYLRVYKQAGAELLDATPHRIPGEWMILGENIPARIDELDEDIAGVQGYGTMLVVPGAQSLDTSFDFSLPSSILTHEKGSNQLIYRLKVQKQPGTIANPLTIRIHLPARSQVNSINLDAIVQDDNLLIETDLRTDVYLELVFLVP